MPPISNDHAAFTGRPGIDPITPQLLVSVRDPTEIADAIASGADIVDLKEPRRGPLAPADHPLWVHAASLWAAGMSSRSPWLSAALGEQADAARVATRLPPEFDFAKVGPSGCDSAEKVLALWSQVRRLLDDRIELVAVAYADHRSAKCIEPETLFRLAIDAGFRRCLIDTYIKDGRSTLDHLGLEGLSRLAAVASKEGLWWTLAGSVRASCVSLLRQHTVYPNCFGVRGDVCQQGRTGTLSTDRIKIWKKSLAQHRPDRSP